MWPFSFRSIFRNRWWTLAWAASICWIAVNFAQDTSGKDDPASADPDVAAALKQAEQADLDGAFNQL